VKKDLRIQSQDFWSLQKKYISGQRGNLNFERRLDLKENLELTFFSQNSLFETQNSLFWGQNSLFFPFKKKSSFV